MLANETMWRIDPSQDAFLNYSMITPKCGGYCETKVRYYVSPPADAGYGPVADQVIIVQVASNSFMRDNTSYSVLQAAVFSTLTGQRVRMGPINVVATWSGINSRFTAGVLADGVTVGVQLDHGGATLNPTSLIFDVSGIWRQPNFDGIYAGQLLLTKEGDALLATKDHIVATHAVSAARRGKQQPQLNKDSQLPDSVALA